MTEKSNAKTTPHSMGIGMLGDPQLVFVRAFRWVLEGESEDNTDSLSEHFQKSVVVDLANKRLHIDVLEVALKNTVLDWADAVQQNPSKNRWLILTTFDGCGYPIYRYQFNGLQIFERNVTFDYGSSDVATHKLVVLFKSYTREFLYAPQSFSKNYKVSFSANNQTRDFIVVVNQEPQCKDNVWMPIKIVVPQKEHKEFIRFLCGCDEATLSLYRGHELSEQWVLESPHMNKVDLNTDNCHIELGCSTVSAITVEGENAQ